ncbi:putative lipid II flippase FtsW [Paenibacillus sp. IB182496]|uniref:Probable peptidoglycan glycosyltransferase FtsW n=1 Tax=Paenibacillus sabuli TaxID=2772509 RepID=A0A927BUX7_9BACL|nr:putative lipid II flippase FtsW [Paenibacillus sabuli]MBD2846200.1 putative lipid II flippase FtsW [Paenibacillus sabuli]
MNKPQTRTRGRPDFVLLILTLLLSGFGLVMVFSASSNIAVSSAEYGHDALYFLKRQLVWVALGTVIMLTVMNIRYERFKKGFILYFLPVLLMLIIVPFIGEERNGARSWFGFAGLGIQPTEFAKLALILYLGRLITKKGEKFREFKRGLLPIMVIVGFICGLIMLQPDLGSCLILAATAAVMIVAGGANLKHLFYSGVIVSVVVALMVSASMLHDPMAWQYRIDRFTTMMNPLEDMQGSGWHLSHSLFALGHGGLTGVGLGDGVQKLHYLTYAYSDFIFAVIGEEFGFIGSVLFLLVYLVFLWRGLLVCLRCSDVYGTVVGAGIVGMIAIQAFVNIGGVTGTIPITGVTLPFISHGGSSMLVVFGSVGVLLSISREYDRQPQRSTNKRKPTAR